MHPLHFLDPVNSPTSSLFSDFGALSISQRRKVSAYYVSYAVNIVTGYFFLMNESPVFLTSFEKA